MRSISVGSAPALVPLASLEDLKTDLGITDAQSDQALQRFLMDATEVVLAFIGRPLLSQTWQDQVFVRHFPRTLSLLVGAYPVQKVLGILRNGTALSQDEVDDLVIADECGEIYRPDTERPFWPPGRYEITYQAGYQPPASQDDGTALPGNIPRPIQLAIRRVAAASYYAEGRDPALKSESAQGIGSTSWVTPDPTLGGLTPEAAGLVQRYQSSGIG
ncbi:phage head-tail connector protein [Gluconobacter oxydans]|uniref:phage head-tail connector protein n=1 Tax=Gluconobacter oxydans TaxID=442 RepID=UPI0034649780